MSIDLTWPITSDGAGAVQYSANDWRTLLTNLFDEGVLGAGSFVVSERALGTNMTLDITAGVAVLAGDDSAGQGNYLIEASETLSAVTIGTADASNPRIDLVGIQLRDPSEGGAAGRDAVFAVEAGTPAASPTAPSTPDSFLVLAEVTVPASASAIEDADIDDTRVFVGRWDVPGALMDVAALNRTVSGWLPCDGAAVSRSTYANLFAAIGTTYGVGDGSTTFNVPDFRARIALPAGGSHAAGESDGAEAQTLATAQLPSHNHSLNGHTHSVPAHMHGLTGGITSSGAHVHDAGQLAVDTGGAWGNASAASGGSVDVAEPFGSVNSINGVPSGSSGHTHTDNFAVASGGSGTSGAASGNTGNTGSADPVSVMQPYLVVATKLIRT